MPVPLTVVLLARSRGWTPWLVATQVLALALCFHPHSSQRVQPPGARETPCAVALAPAAARLLQGSPVLPSQLQLSAHERQPVVTTAPAAAVHPVEEPPQLATVPTPV